MRIEFVNKTGKWKVVLRCQGQLIIQATANRKKSSELQVILQTSNEAYKKEPTGEPRDQPMSGRIPENAETQREDASETGESPLPPSDSERDLPLEFSKKQNSWISTNKYYKNGLVSCLSWCGTNTRCHQKYLGKTLMAIS